MEIEFGLLGRRKKLVISAFTDFTSNKIGRNTVYIALRFGNKGRKNHQL